MSRETCYRCYRPKSICFCASIQPMPTRSLFVLLMHPKEFKQVKAATGRLTHLCLAGSQVHIGVGFEHHEAVQALIQDPGNYPVLLYPGRTALNLSNGELKREELAGKRLVIFVLDATWGLARKMLRLSPSLKLLPRIVFTPSQPSRYVIKQQPHVNCLSTLEATHELLTVLDRQGLDEYGDPSQLLRVFAQMQEIQIRCAADPAREGYRRRAYRPPAVRTLTLKGRSGERRLKALGFSMPG
jgi:DTW domain-containing protein